MHIPWVLGLAVVASAACPYMNGGESLAKRTEIPECHLEERDTDAQFLEQSTVVGDVSADTYLTTDAGGPIEDNQTLKAGERGPSLLEDFIFRQKIQHFDHERVSTPFRNSKSF